MENKTMISGYVTLFVGVGLLVFTFASAYLLLSNDPTIRGSSDLVTVFGEALAPLILTCIRIMYLGVMGWIGSILTVRGVNLVTKPKVNLENRPTYESMLPESWLPENDQLKKTRKPVKRKKNRSLAKNA